MAEAANEAGNAAYKEGQFVKAHKFYHEAARLNPDEPKYFSNLSAVCYEQGKYVPCVKGIIVAWQNLVAQNKRSGRPPEPPYSDPFAIKLATRLAKAKINGFNNKSISLHTTPPNPMALQKEKATKAFEAAIEDFAMAERTGAIDAKAKEMRSVWDQWRAIRSECSTHGAKECKKKTASAKERLRALRIFKSACDPTMEYFKFGHDEVQSLMEGLNREMDEYAMDIMDFEDEEEEPNISFLFGGSGDARHVFGTLIHFADFSNELGDEAPVDWLSTHMTLVDIHPATLARTIVMFALLHKILQIRLSQDKVKRAELYATLFYLFTSMLMPEYCRRIIQDIAKTLVAELPRGTHSLSKCLHINEKSLPAIIDVLRYWSTPLPKTATAFLQRTANIQTPCRKVLEMQKSSKSGSPPNLEDLLETMMGRGQGSSFRTKKSNETKSLQGPADPYDDSFAEAEIYDRVKALLPPRTLLSRHPALAKLVKSYKTAPQSAYTAAAQEVEQTWKPNPTIFDKDSTENPEYGGGVGYPAVTGSPYDTLLSFARFSKEYQRGSGRPKKTGYAIMTQFFELAAEAIWTLRNALKVEMVIMDVITGVPKLMAGDLGPRPKEFPIKYSRMWLSNVPDYTNGPLNTAVHLTPYLKPDALVLSNCLLNTGIFNSIHDLCYNYALLCTHKLPHFLGCRVLDDHGSPFNDIAIQSLPLPRPIDELASKKELHTWLAHLLLCTLSNAKPSPPPIRVELPNNINAFFHVLVHLHRVGFPSHWLGDFVQSMVSNNLVTDVVPYMDILPVPTTEINNKKPPRKVQLAAWQAELQVILASVGPALPFSAALPKDYPSFKDIQTFRAAVEPVNRNPSLFSMSSPFAKTVGLLFYRPLNNVDVDTIACRVPCIIEGDCDMNSVQVQIMLSTEVVDIRHGQISWKMSTSWYEKMRKEGWKMAAYRTDMTITVTEPVKADKWVQIS